MSFRRHSREPQPPHEREPPLTLNQAKQVSASAYERTGAPPMRRAVVCTPPASRCIAPGGLSVVLLPPDALGHLTHHPRSQCPQQLGMVVSEVPLSR